MPTTASWHCATLSHELRSRFRALSDLTSTISREDRVDIHLAPVLGQKRQLYSSQTCALFGVGVLLLMSRGLF